MTNEHILAALIVLAVLVVLSLIGIAIAETRDPPHNKPRKGVLRAPSKDCVRMYPDV